MSETSQYRPRTDASVRKRTKVCYFFCLKCPKPNGTVQEQTRSSANGSKCPKPDGIVQKQIQLSETRSTKSPLQEDIVSLRLLASVSACFHVIWDSCALFLARRTSVILCGRRRQVRGQCEVRVASVTSRMPPFAYKNG